MRSFDKVHYDCKCHSGHIAQNHNQEKPFDELFARLVATLAAALWFFFRFLCLGQGVFCTLNLEEIKYWIRHPKYAEKIFAERPPLSEATILSLILFLHGDPQENYSLCIEAMCNFKLVFVIYLYISVIFN